MWGWGSVGLEGVSWRLWGKGLGMWAGGMRGCRAGGQLWGFGSALGLEHVGERAVG